MVIALSDLLPILDGILEFAVKKNLDDASRTIRDAKNRLYLVDWEGRSKQVDTIIGIIATLKSARASAIAEMKKHSHLSGIVLEERSLKQLTKTFDNAIDSFRQKKRALEKG
jgi:uncharacterized protein YeeX (DUF496 family)